LITRPISGGTPKTSNVFMVMWFPRSRRGSPEPVQITSLIVEAITPLKILLRRANSRYWSAV
jgi:hypothetical protein